jgi:hypothetical protein
MDLKELIDKLPKAKKREWSYLETIGVAHRETIMANLLAFYFDPEGLHGLGDIFIRALLQTKPKHLSDKYVPVDVPPEVGKIAKNGFSRANIIVEEPTDDNKRLDILIETDQLVIAIEFKINHHLNNPLKHYVDRVISQYPQEEIKKYYVVLTPQWKEPIDAAAKPVTDFKQVILSDFISKVKAVIEDEGKFKSHDEAHQRMLYTDFLNTIENKKIRINMINEYFDSVRKGDLTHEQIENAFKQFNDLKNHLEEKMDEFLKRLNEKSDNNFALLSGSKDKIESVAYCTKGDIQIKIRLNLNGWAIERWKKELRDWKRIETEEKPHEEPITNLVKVIERHLILQHQSRIISGHSSES